MYISLQRDCSAPFLRKVLEEELVGSWFCGKFEAIMEKIRQREQEGRSSPLGKTHQKFFSTIWSFLFQHIAYSYFTGMKEIPLKIWVS